VCPREHYVPRNPLAPVPGSFLQDPPLDDIFVGHADSIIFVWARAVDFAESRRLPIWHFSTQRLVRHALFELRVRRSLKQMLPNNLDPLLLVFGRVRGQGKDAFFRDHLEV